MVKRFSLTVFMVLVLAITTFVPVYAQEIQPVDPMNPVPTVELDGFVDETANLWFVELNSNPTVDGASLSVTKAEKRAFRDAARRAGVKYTERMAFDTLWNGLSIKIDKSQLSAVSMLPGVKAVYPIETVAMPIPYTDPYEPELYTALAQTGADLVQSQLEFTGAGIKVAVMDTGIDYNHPAFSGNGVAEMDSHTFPTARVVTGWDFVGDSYNADPASAAYQPVPHPDAYPDDCNGHGTHVAGIVGANDATNDLTGVAPDVTFGAYRVFGCEGSTESDIMLAAMEMALSDGMDVLNMSIGSAFQWPQYPTAVAASRLVDKGMVVVASIGNSGASGLYSAGAPGLGEKVIGVASFDNTNVMLPYLTVNSRNIGYITMTFSPNPPTSGTEEVVWLGRGCVDADLALAGNQPDPYLGDPNGKVALVQRGFCTFGEKANRAIAAGATAVLVQNNALGVFNGTLGAALPDPKPVVGISLEDGNFLRSQTAPVMMTWTDQIASFASPTANQISSFSSYGLSPDLALKPDFGAPGGNIYSSFPLEKGGYATMSGTSMSSPHVAGAVALLLQAKPGTVAADIRGILQNSADPKSWFGNPALGFLDSVNHQGAGMLKIDKAIQATTSITPAKIATGESQAGPFTQSLKIVNSSATAVTYDLTAANALTVRNTFAPAFSTSDASVMFTKDGLPITSVTVGANGVANIKAVITPASGPNKGQYGGYLVFTPQETGQVVRVPFAGFVGDYQSIQVLTPTANNFPWLAVLYEGAYYQVTDPTDWTFTMKDGDFPYFLVHLDHQARSMKFDVLDMTGKVLKPFAVEEYLPRNSSANGFYTWAFVGLTFAGNKAFTIPDGTYQVKISLLKALGNKDNPADWEYWTSPAFVIDRP
ncbi:MAG TPA: S8 family serine peptidase [Bellilinea sp.]|nr:S8 family serine peptidase [Bellilinea sp.]